ncbi:MAG: response regulator [Proteobacteria bacterium]|nr:response regulator [Desulfobacula sp.]MBU3953509.1 response regulator [Pseudomonadota bacterium]MBU4132711.1 response regulator [Pseudomonadota bacterium]
MEKPNAELKILLVDDSLSMRRIIVKFLANNGITQVLEAGDGVEALAAIASTRVDLIVSDLNMPRMNGMAFLEQIKANPHTRDIRFIMLTVEAIQKTMNKALSLGVDSYIVKPVTEKIFMEELIRVVGDASKEG